MADNAISPELLAMAERILTDEKIPKAAINAFQQSLKDMGFNIGVDGDEGPQTRARASALLLGKELGDQYGLNPSSLRPDLLESMVRDSKVQQYATAHMQALKQHNDQPGKTQIDIAISTNQVFQESRFNPTAANIFKNEPGKSSYGMYQFTLGTGKEHGLKSVADLNDPDKARTAYIEFTAQALKSNNNDQILKLVRYNAGQGAIDYVKRELGQKNITGLEWVTFMRNESAKRHERNKDTPYKDWPRDQRNKWDQVTLQYVEKNVRDLDQRLKAASSDIEPTVENKESASDMVKKALETVASPLSPAEAHGADNPPTGPYESKAIEQAEQQKPETTETKPSEGVKTMAEEKPKSRQEAGVTIHEFQPPDVSGGLQNLATRFANWLYGLAKPTAAAVDKIAKPAAESVQANIASPAAKIASDPKAAAKSVVASVSDAVGPVTVEPGTKAVTAEEYNRDRYNLDEKVKEKAGQAVASAKEWLGPITVEPDTMLAKNNKDKKEVKPVDKETIAEKPEEKPVEIATLSFEQSGYPSYTDAGQLPDADGAALVSPVNNEQKVAAPSMITPDNPDVVAAYKETAETITAAGKENPKGEKTLSEEFVAWAKEGQKLPSVEKPVTMAALSKEEVTGMEIATPQQRDFSPKESQPSTPVAKTPPVVEPSYPDQYKVELHSRDEHPLFILHYIGDGETLDHAAQRLMNDPLARQEIFDQIDNMPMTADESIYLTNTYSDLAERFKKQITSNALEGNSLHVAAGWIGLETALELSLPPETSPQDKQSFVTKQMAGFLDKTDGATKAHLQIAGVAVADEYKTGLSAELEKAKEAKEPLDTPKEVTKEEEPAGVGASKTSNYQKPSGPGGSSWI